MATLSFSLNEHVATGEGGLALTNVNAPAERRRGLRSLCFGKTRRFVREELGRNFCMSDLQAAVGAAQHERLPQTIEQKHRIGG
ncbi:MAG: DegT/DnrJ/EryC1/StrS family aminotransferase [Xanthobacteraceae bacterium]